MTSMADCATGTAAGFGAERGAGSSLSSSSSIRADSEQDGSKILSKDRKPGGVHEYRLQCCCDLKLMDIKVTQIKNLNTKHFKAVNENLTIFFLKVSLTHLDLFPLCVLFMTRPFARLTWCRSGACYFALGHPQIQQQGADLTLELQTARMFEDCHEVQLQVLPHAADLRLGQSWRQVC